MCAITLRQSWTLLIALGCLYTTEPENRISQMAVTSRGDRSTRSAVGGNMTLFDGYVAVDWSASDETRA